MSEIAFGTDGWRAVIGEDFTPTNIMKIAQAFCDLHPKLEKSGRGVVIGYDRRNRSPESAELIASVLLANNIPVVLSKDFCPTPCVSWHVKHKGHTAGIMVTASHNPPQWNGIKLKEASGGAASEDFVRPIEEQIHKNDREGRSPKQVKVKGHPLLSFFDPSKEYVDALRRFVDIELIRQRNFLIIVDPLYGAGSGFFPCLLGHLVEEIHNKADPNFGGLHPEPIPPHVNELMERMKQGNYSCGLILDGDADRAGAVDEKGDFVTTHEVYSLLIRHAVKHKGWKGKIIKSISTTQMVDRLAKKYHLDVEIVPVGFKYISPAMKNPKVMIGGEESGGFGFPSHIPERDGILANLMLLELMATEKKKLSQLVADLQSEVGPCRYKRHDYHLSREQIDAARWKFNSLNIAQCAGHRMVQHTTIDGHHFLFDDDSWLLFRASGTEPLIRVYAEAPTFEEVDSLLAEGKRQLGL